VPEELIKMYENVVSNDGHKYNTYLERLMNNIFIYLFISAEPWRSNRLQLSRDRISSTSISFPVYLRTIENMMQSPQII